MSLAAATVIASMPLLGNVHLDADVLGWNGLRGDDFVVRVQELRDGRPRGRAREVWRSAGSAALEDLDVAASGAAVVCLRERARQEDQTWRVRIVRRSPQGVWSEPILVADPKRWVESVSCGIGDAGQVTLTWMELDGDRARTAAVAPDGTVEAPTTLVRDPIDDPLTEVAPDGSATSVYTLDDPGRVLYVAERPAGGRWSTRAIAPAFGPEFAMDGTGRAVLAWDDPREGRRPLSFAAAPAFAPAAFVHEDGVSVRALAAGPRGDVLAAWATSSYPRAGALRVAVSRPGAPFSAPTLLGRYASSPVLTALDAAGGGAVAAVSGSERRPRPYVRVLRPDGSWGARLAVRYDLAALAAAGPGRFTLVTAQRDRYGSYKVLRVRTVT